jgi:endo-1,4-beta-xylanase
MRFHTTTAFPAKAGTHRPTAPPAEEWVPACAGNALQRAAPTRRDFLAGAAAIAAIPGISRAAPTGGLRAIAAASGLLYGSYIDLVSPAYGPEYRIVAAHECGLNVSSRMDWGDLAPTPERTEFAGADSDYAWGRAHDMKFQGHCLVWGEALPHWFADVPDRTAAEAALRNHVSTVCRHFAGRTQSWIVVNEAILIYSGRPDKLRPQALLDKLGPEYIEIAFAVAKESDPAGRLVYNDFGVEVDTPDHNGKRAALLALLDRLQKRKVPVDTIGLQSHLYYELMPHFDDKQFSGFLRELAGRGLEIMITELDVVDRGAPADIAKRDADVAAIYRRYLDVALDNPAVKTVITWGLTDRISWIVNGPDPDTRRTDKLPPRPLPFDASYVPKPAYFAIAEAFRAAPPR